MEKLAQCMAVMLGGVLSFGASQAQEALTSKQLAPEVRNISVVDQFGLVGRSCGSFEADGTLAALDATVGFTRGGCSSCGISQFTLVITAPGGGCLKVNADGFFGGTSRTACFPNRVDWDDSWTGRTDGVYTDQISNLDAFGVEGAGSWSWCVGHGSQESAAVTYDVDIDVSFQPPPPSITGRVTRTDNGSGVSGMIVDIFESNQLTLAAEATTDSSGNYSISGLADGNYFARTRNGFDAGINLINEVYDDISCPFACNLGNGAVISVSGAAAQQVDFALDPGASILGRVTRATDGAALANMVVGLQQVIGNDLFFASQGVTDSNGDWRVDGLPAGEYLAILTLFTNADLVEEVYNDVACPCDWRDGDLIVVQAGGARSGIDFSLESTGLTISGNVSSPDGPVEGFEMTAYDPNVGVGTGFNNRRIGATDSSGDYEIHGVSSGDWVVRTEDQSGNFAFAEQWYDSLPISVGIENATRIAVGPQSPTSIDFFLEEGGSIAGRVTLADTGEGTVALLIATNQDTNETFSGGPDMGEDGFYVIPGLSPGTYRLETFNVGQFNNVIKELYDNIHCATIDCDGQEGTPLVITGNTALTDINFVLEAGGIIRGAVSEDDTGDPMPGILVALFNADNRFVNLAFLDPGGAFTLPGLPTGGYKLITQRAGNFARLNEAFDNQPCIGVCDPALANAIAVTVGETVDIQLELGTYPVFSDATPQELDELGASLAIEGDILLVGVPGDDEAGQDAGAVLLFRRVAGTFSLDRKFFAESPAPEQRFGASVAIEDGIIVVGAPGSDVSGKAPKGIDKGAHVFRLTGAAPAPIAQLVASNLANAATAGFGASVDIEGGMIVVGAPNAEKLNADDAGTPSGATSGAVIVFDPNGDRTGWAQSVVLTDPDGASGDGFGTSVSASGDRVAVGVPNQLSPTALGSGLVQVFQNLGGSGPVGNIGKFGPVASNDGAEFGASVVLSGDLLLAGAPGARVSGMTTGAAYAFEFDGGNFNQMAELVPVDPRQTDAMDQPLVLGRDGGRFGTSVAMRGGTALIGAAMEDAGVVRSGAAYVYGRSIEGGSEFELADRIVPDDAGGGARLGAAVVIDNETLALGAPGTQASGVAAGAVLNVAADIEDLFGDGFETP